ncbi:MAG: TadE family protein [Pirellulaceae bacterium]|nr:TadE family protein [Pirellulaceae bacterium]
MIFGSRINRRVNPKVNSAAQRSGAVLVEFALVLPVIMFTFACMIEISRVMLLQHTADTAAYEGARSAMVPGATATNAVDTATELLTAAGLKTTKVTVTPQAIDETTPVVTVLVEVPVAANYWISPMLFQESVVKSEVTLFSERPPVVQLTGVPAIKKKATQTKGSATSL